MSFRCSFPTQLELSFYFSVLCPTYSITEDPVEKTDVFVLSSIQQCEKWKGFSGHRYVEQARNFDNRNTDGTEYSKMTIHHIPHE